MRGLVAIAVIAASCLACSPAHLGTSAISRPIRRPVLGTPSLPFEDVAVKTKDGLTLRGWLFRPEGVPRGLVVYLHGMSNNRRQGVDTVAERFVPDGYAVLGFDNRAHGESEGEWLTYGHHEVADLRAALDQVGITPVVLTGESLGAAIALQTAAVDPRVVAVVAAAPFSDLETIVTEVGGPFGRSDSLLEAVRAELRAEAGFDLTSISPRRAAAEIGVPVLLVHGTRDTYTDISHSERLLAALPGEKRLLRVIGATHYDVLDHSNVWDAIERWLAEVGVPGAARLTRAN